jgi:hypothetical protein
MSEISVTVNGSTTINPTVGNGDVVNVTIASTGERGPTGATGSAGPANALAIGTVTQGTAAATITGTSPNQVLNLVLQKGDAGTNIELQATGTHIQWRLVGGSTWTNLVALSAITGPTGSTGAAGAAVELQATSTHLQWRYVGGSTWTNVFALSSLVGATGPQGPQGPAGPPINLGDETPQPLGTASAGTALTAARADHVHAVGSVQYSSLSGIPSTFAPAAHTHAVSDVTGLQTALDGKQAAGTYATLVGGTVPSAQLPSFVDDIVEYANLAAFTATGEVGKIFVARDTGKIYRWSGSAYIEISPSPGSTDSVTEGSTNLYYTNVRAAAAAPVQSVNTKTGAVALTASDVGAAATSHTHSLADLTQSSATTGQVPTWNGTAWAAATPSAGGGGSANIVEAATAAGFPATGASSTLYVATDTSRVYRWAGSVYVELGASGGGSSSVVFAASAAAFPATGAVGTLYVATTPRTIWYWSGSAYLPLGGSAGTLPGAPTNLTATTSSNRLDLTWTAPASSGSSSITEYVIQYFNLDDSFGWTYSSTTYQSGTSAYIIGLINGNRYRLRVAAVTSVGIGDYVTTSGTFTPAAAAGITVLSGSASGSGTNTITATATGNISLSVPSTRTLTWTGAPGQYIAGPQQAGFSYDSEYGFWYRNFVGSSFTVIAGTYTTENTQNGATLTFTP